jgi:hypothetical protein
MSDHVYFPEPDSGRCVANGDEPFCTLSPEQHQPPPTDGAQGPRLSEYPDRIQLRPITSPDEALAYLRWCRGVFWGDRKERSAEIRTVLVGLRADLAMSNATIEAQAVALSQMQEALDHAGAGLAGTYGYMVKRGDEASAADVMEWIEQLDDALAQSQPEAVEQARAVLDAADECHGLLLMLATDLLRNGRSPESLIEVKRVLQTYDRLRTGSMEAAP